LTPQYTHSTRSQSVSNQHISPRLRLKASASAGGHLDGAWWPRSSDLGTELPDLLAALAVRIGHIDRVLYNVREWSNGPAKLATGGRRVRLDGYHRQPTNTVEVVGLDRARIVLLAVPADAYPAEAQFALRDAARSDSRATARDILLMAQHAD